MAWPPPRGLGQSVGDKPIVRPVIFAPQGGGAECTSSRRRSAFSCSRESANSEFSGRAIAPRRDPARTSQHTQRALGSPVTVCGVYTGIWGYPQNLLVSPRAVNGL